MAFARILLFLILLSPVGVSAFGQMGHRVICELAYSLLVPARQQQIDDLLREIPPTERRRLNAYQRRDSAATIDFGSACLWPDAIKNDRSYAHTASWHYINVMRNAPGVTAADCVSGCLLSALAWHHQILESAAPSWAKTQALIYVGHWLGDIHQPLHVSFADDRGGNDVPIADPRPECSNLHRAWDFCLIEMQASNDRDLLKLLGEVKALSIAPISMTDYLIWANESYHLARRPGAGYCTQQAGHCAAQTDAVRIDADYLARNWPLLAERLTLSAQRLAVLLETSL